MTWIKTVSMEEDERVKKAMLEQRKVYPVEYATPVPAVDHGMTAVPLVQRVRRDDVTGVAAEPAAARNDYHARVGDEPVPLLNRISRRVSA
jgi:hypothetical protein